MAAVTVVDTSAWVEFLRATGSETDRAVDALVADGGILVPDVVQMELLVGSEREQRADELSRFLARFTPLPSSSPADHELAAALYRRVRRNGATVRSILDCLIAAMAMRVEAPLLARDADFRALAAVSDLQLV